MGRAYLMDQQSMVILEADESMIKMIGRAKALQRRGLTRPSKISKMWGTGDVVYQKGEEHLSVEMDLVVKKEFRFELL